MGKISFPAFARQMECWEHWCEQNDDATISITALACACVISIDFNGLCDEEDKSGYHWTRHLGRRYTAALRFGTGRSLCSAPDVTVPFRRASLSSRPRDVKGRNAPPPGNVGFSDNPGGASPSPAGLFHLFGVLEDWILVVRPARGDGLPVCKWLTRSGSASMLRFARAQKSDQYSPR